MIKGMIRSVSYNVRLEIQSIYIRKEEKVNQAKQLSNTDPKI